MKYLATLLLSLLPLMAAETPITYVSTPFAKLPSTMFSELDALKLENIQLRRQIANTTIAELDASLNALFLKNCQAIGGVTMADCTVVEPSEKQPGFGVMLKITALTTADRKK